MNNTTHHTYTLRNNEKKKNSKQKMLRKYETQTKEREKYCTQMPIQRSEMSTWEIL